MLWVGAAGVLASVAGCGGADNRAPAWSYISPAIMQPNCATSSCHSEAAAIAGLDMSTPEAGYRSLLKLQLRLPMPADDEKSTVYETNRRAFVVPFHPESSRVVNMMRANQAQRMPPDRPLAEADIALVETWILRGALED